MRFKLDENVDENVDVRVEAPLSAASHDVATVVGQDLGGAVDPVVAETVRAEGRILVTLDRGFADLRAYPPGSRREQDQECAGAGGQGRRAHRAGPVTGNDLLAHGP